MSVQGNDFPPAEPEAVPSFSRYFCLLRKLPMPGSGTGPSDDQFHPKIFASSPVFAASTPPATSAPSDQSDFPSVAGSKSAYA